MHCSTHLGKCIHFIGTCGIGMSAIARILIHRGHTVTGSDSSDSPLIAELTQLGARCFFGHHPDYVKGADLVVYSPAVPEDNCELAAAAALGIPVISRAEMLNRLAETQSCIAVSGSHGKSTTSWLVAHLLIEAGLDPTVLVGANVPALKGNSRDGGGEYLVAEVDESDGVFHRMRSALAVVTNIDREHLDFYRGLKHVQQHFRDFIKNSAGGMGAIVCSDNKAALEVVESSGTKVLKYGAGKAADLRVTEFNPTGSGSHFEVEWDGRPLGEFYTPLLGRHNVMNCVAAVGVGLRLGLSPEKISETIAQNTGVDRRLSHRSTVNDIAIWDDYGHHPTELKSTLEALRPAVKRRLIVVFQPHRYSRTLHLHKEFGRSLAQADHVIVTNIYAASEQPMEGVDSRLVVKAARKHCRGEVERIEEKEFVPAHLSRIAKPGDTILFQGAGDVFRLARVTAARLAADEAAVPERNVG